MIVSMLKSIWREEVLAYRYGKHVVAAVFCVCIGFGGYQFYVWHKTGQEKAAQAVLAEAMDEFDKAMFYLLDPKHQNTQLAEQFFKDAELAFNVVATSYGNSNYLPYVYAFQADIQLRQGDKQKALALLDQSIKAFSSSHPIYNMMRIKRALVLLDTGDVTQAIEQLESLAADKNNIHADTAAFYLGYYYLATDKQSDCIRVWTKMRDAMKDVKSRSGRSAWLTIVEEKLQQLGEH